MSAKRTVSSSPSPKKKQKFANQPQGTLDTFLQRRPTTSRTNDGRSPQAQSLLRASGSNVSAVDDDEALARRLASEEGMDMDAVRHMERQWKMTTASSSKVQLTDIIDVDAPDEHIPSPMALVGVQMPAALASTSIAGDESRDSPKPSPKPTKSISEVSKGKAAATAASASPSFPSLLDDPLLFSPEACSWPEKGAPYSFLSHTFCSLSATRSRIAISNILTNCLRLIIVHDPPSLLPALYLLSNSLTPPYIPVELGLGPSIISKAIQHVSGITPAALRRLYNKSGDAGDVAFEASSKQRTLVPHAALTVRGVYDSLMKICKVRGEGATKQKQSIVEKLLVAAKGEETRYLVRTLCQHLRVGAVRTSMLTALSRAMVLSRPLDQTVPQHTSAYYAASDLLAKVKVLTTTKGKKKGNEDPARQEILAKFIEAEGLVKKVYVQHPNYDHIIAALLEVGLEGLADRISLSIGIPLHPTLGSPMRSLDEIYDRLGDLPFTAEFKYDGQRAQIHAVRNGGGVVDVKIFSRHLEDMTDKYPDVVAVVSMIFDESAELASFIMDAEIVAVDAQDGSLKTFQELSNRARKDVRLEDIKISVCIFAFDLMYIDGKSLLEAPFRARRQVLRTRFPPLSPAAPNISRFAHVESCESTDGKEEIEEFWQKAVDGRSEGLMIKLLDNGEMLEDDSDAKGKSRRKPLPATYEPDKRTFAWLKLKKDYVLGLGDSLDLVPIGAWHGNGRKAQWWSPILLAVWDEHAGNFVAVCKCMSGFTDNFYKALSERYSEGSNSCSRTSQWNCNTGGLTPTVYFKPQEVWEIRGADITQSPVSVAALGLVSQTRGLSLRFPRFIRIREDKHTTDASTPEFLASMWRKQDGKGKKGIDDGELVDVSPEASEAELDEYDDS